MSERTVLYLLAFLCGLLFCVICYEFRKTLTQGRERQLWLAGRPGEYAEDWIVLGVYSSEIQAVDRCQQFDDFVCPLLLDTEHTHDPFHVIYPHHTEARHP